MIALCDELEQELRYRLRNIPFDFIYDFITRGAGTGHEFDRNQYPDVNNE